MFNYRKRSIVNMETVNTASWPKVTEFLTCPLSFSTSNKNVLTTVLCEFGYCLTTKHDDKEDWRSRPSSICVFCLFRTQIMILSDNPFVISSYIKHTHTLHGNNSTICYNIIINLDDGNIQLFYCVHSGRCLRNIFSVKEISFWSFNHPMNDLQCMVKIVTRHNAYYVVIVENKIRQRKCE